MTETPCLCRVEELVAALPGVSSARLSRSKSGNISGTFTCTSLAGFDAISRCSTGANVAVTLGQTNSKEFRKLGPVVGLNCHTKFNDTATELPTKCQVLGFYAATLLYNASLIGDAELDEIESKWKVHFRRNGG